MPSAGKQRAAVRLLVRPDECHGGVIETRAELDRFMPAHAAPYALGSFLCFAPVASNDGNLFSYHRSTAGHLTSKN